jgi:magnesium chelatase family protein
MVSVVKTVAPVGFDGQLVEVECDATKSLPSLQIVGLGNKAIDEARERVRSAINNSLLEFPKKRITINLAPAELPKDGAHYDLPIALSILCVGGKLTQNELDNAIFAGELALDGGIRPIKGVINIVEKAKSSGYKTVYLPMKNTAQASLITDMEIYGIESLKELYLHLKQEIVLKPYEKQNNTPKERRDNQQKITLDDIKGQEHAKRAMIIAAAGHHNILLSGSPGAGKTMLAKALANLLPDLSEDEVVSITKIHNLTCDLDGEIIMERPFRSPHHTSSIISIVGGGKQPKPGEISLAHTGVLFLDELPEYPRSILESLRQPLEDKKIDVTRVNGHATYPADFMLVATMNPCPCGYLGDSTKECSCTSNQILAYQKKLSGPLIDRVDLRVNVSKVPNEKLLASNTMTNKQHITSVNMINNAKKMQRIRYNSSTIYNSSLSNSQIKRYVKLTNRAQSLLLSASDKLNLSARGYFKVIKIARTIADLDEKVEISEEHISEALQYRIITT